MQRSERMHRLLLAVAVAGVNSPAPSHALECLAATLASRAIHAAARWTNEAVERAAGTVGAAETARD
jgi:hypothetical protein